MQPIDSKRYLQFSFAYGKDSLGNKIKEIEMVRSVCAK